MKRFQGAARRQPFLVPDQPVAIALVGQFVVVAVDDGIFIYDGESTQMVGCVGPSANMHALDAHAARICAALPDPENRLCS